MHTPPLSFRLKSAASALLLAASSSVYSLGLGELSHSSYLGEPLKAQIDIIPGNEDYGVDQLRANVLSPAEAQKLGIELVAGFQSYRLRPVSIDGRTVIEVTTAGNFSEPFVNLLVELRWPTGRIFREYTLLLDPPLINQPSAVAAQPRTQANARKPAATNAVPDLQSSSDSYRVQPGDSLSKIAQRFAAATGERRQPMMRWLLANNPSAFIDGDANRIKAGAKLRLPAGAIVAPRADAPAASTRASVSAAPAQPSAAVVATPSQPNAQAPEQTRLTLTTESPKRTGILAQNPADLNTSQLQSRLDAVNELNERLIRETRLLEERLTMVEGSTYLENLEKLVALKEQQIDALKAQLQSKNAAATAVPAAEAIESESHSVTDTTAAAIVEQQQAKSAASAEKAEDNAFIGWWLAILAGFVAVAWFYFRPQKEPQAVAVEESANQESDEQTLAELDEIMDQHAAKAAASATYSSFERANPDQPKRVGWRPDSEVFASIQQKTEGYTPPVYEGEESGVHHHDEVEDLIAEAMSYGKKGYYDTAEALLFAERARTGPNARIDEAIEFLRNKKSENPWDAR